MSTEAEVFESWAILELMGRRRLAGFVREQTVGGAAFVRIDVPGDGIEPNGSPAWAATQLYSPSAIYCITPCTEELARQVAERNRPEPVHVWELPRPSAPKVDELNDLDDEEEEETDDWPQEFSNA